LGSSTWESSQKKGERKKKKKKKQNRKEVEFTWRLLSAQCFECSSRIETGIDFSQILQITSKLSLVVGASVSINCSLPVILFFFFFLEWIG
jgi:hypothetical protein